MQLNNILEIGQYRAYSPMDMISIRSGVVGAGSCWNADKLSDCSVHSLSGMVVSCVGYLGSFHV